MRSVLPASTIQIKAGIHIPAYLSYATLLK